MSLVEIKQYLRSLEVTFFYDRGVKLWTLVQPTGTDYFTKDTILKMTKDEFIQSYLTT